MGKNDIIINLKSVMDISDVKSNVGNIQQALSKLKLPQDLGESFSKTFSNLEKEIDNFQSKMTKGITSKSDFSGLEKSSEKISNLFDQLVKDTQKLNQLSGKEFQINVDTSKVDEARKKLTQFKTQIGQILKNTNVKDRNQKVLGNLFDYVNDLPSKSAKVKEFMAALESGDFSRIKEGLQGLKEYSNYLSNANTKNAKDFTEGVENINRAVAGLKNNQGFESLGKSASQTTQEIIKLEKDAITKTEAKLNSFGTAAKSASSGTKTFMQSMIEGARNSVQLNAELDQLKSKVTYFLSLTNGVQLFKRAVSDAFETVKSLDKAMTETAVVTNFSVGDMWEQLPTYTEEANKLGVNIQGVYEATTLFYQQGLNQSQSFALATESLKMARIAGLDYEEATNRMTAAIRGFNMAINEQSAQRVNDVYSQLAAITASDVDELSTAMDKTASLANSVGMDFETTSAFLAQGIETTRESADSIGTALKTVLARFTEVKQSVDGIAEVDGEVIDINKVDTALKSVGLSILDANGELRNMGDVFMELSARWNTLDSMQQRYIATQAAGSRQQSRFIAMMSDYDRVLQLQEEAYNANGTSQGQFEKTLDSMETKITNFKNAYDSFVMGLADSSVLKVAVDVGTTLITMLDKITTGSSGAISSITKIASIIGTIKIGKMAFNGFLKSVAPVGKEAANILKTNFENNFKNVKFAFSKQAYSSITDSMATISKRYSSELAKMKVPSMDQFAKAFDIAAQKAQVSASKLSAIVPGIYREIDSQIKNNTTYQLLTQSGKEIVDKFSSGIQQAVSSGMSFQDAINKIKLELQKELQEAGINVDLNEILKIDGSNLNVENLLPEKRISSAAAGIAQSVGLALTALSPLIDKLSQKSDNEFLAGLTAAIPHLGLAITMFPQLTRAIDAVKVAAAGAGVTAGEALAVATAGLSLIIPAIMAIVSAIDAAKEKQLELRQAQIDSQNQASDTFNEEFEQINSLNTELNGLAEAYNETGGSKTEFIEKARELAEVLGVERSEIDGLSGSVEQMQTTLNKKILDKAKADITGIGNLSEGVINSVKNDIEQLDGKISIDFGDMIEDSDVSFSNDFQDFINKNYSEYSDLFSIMDQSGQMFLLGETTADLSKTAEIMKDFFGTINKEGYKGAETLTNFETVMNSLSQHSEESADKIQKVKNNIQGIMTVAMREDGFDNKKISNINQYADGIQQYMDNLIPYASELGYTADEMIDLATNFMSQQGGVAANFAAAYTQAKNIMDILDSGKNSKGIDINIDGNIDTIKQDIDNLLASGNTEALVMIKSAIDEGSFNGSVKEVQDKLAQIDFQARIQIGIQGAESISEASGIVAKGGAESEEEQKILDNLTATLAQLPSLYNENLKASDDWNQVSKQDVIAQLQYLEELSRIQLGISATTDEQYAKQQAYNQNNSIENMQDLEEKKARLELLQSYVQLQNESQRQEFNSAFELGVSGVEEAKAQIQTLEQEIQKLKKYNNTELKIKLDDSINAQVRNTTQLLKQTQEATKLIGEGFRTSAEDFKKLIALMPELGKQAKATATGEIQLNKEVVNSVLSMYQQKGDAAIDASIKALQGQKAEVLGEKQKVDSLITLLTAYEEGKVQLDAQALTAILTNNSIAENAVSVATGNMSTDVGNIQPPAETSGNQIGEIGGVSTKAATSNANAMSAIASNLYEVGQQAYETAQNIAEIGKDNPTNHTTSKRAANKTGGDGTVDAEHKSTDGKKEKVKNSKKELAGQAKAGIKTTGKGGGTASQSFAQKMVLDNLANGKIGITPNAAFLNGTHEQLVPTSSGNNVKVTVKNSNGYVPQKPASIKSSGTTSNQTKNTNSNTGIKVKGTGKDTTITQGGKTITLPTLITTLEGVSKDFDTEAAGIDADIATLQALKNATNNSIGNAKNGSGGDTSKSSGGKGSGSGSGSKKEYGKYDGDMQEAKEQYLASSEEISKDLQEIYNDLLETEGTTVDDLVANLEKQKEVLKDRVDKENELLKAREKERDDALKAFKAAGGKVTKDSYGNIVVDSTAAQKSLAGMTTDSDAYKKFNDTMKDFESKQKAFIDQQKDTKETQKEYNDLIKIDFTEKATADLRKATYDVGVDFLYNQKRIVDEFGRIANEALDEFNDIIDKEGSTYAEAIASLEKYAAAAETKRGALQEELEANKALASYYKNEYADVAKYVSFDLATMSIRVDNAAIEGVTDENIGSRITEAIDAFEEVSDTSNSLEDEISDLDDTIKDSTEKIAEKMEESASNIYNQVWDGMKGQYDDEIKQLEDVNDNINNQTEKLMNSIRDNLEKERQARDNEKTERELADKEARLAYLRRDTTGAKAVEIANLEKELQESRENYTDNLIDQKLDEMEQQFDDAAEQREKEIEVLEKIRDNMEENPDWDKVRQIILEGAPLGNIIPGSLLDTYLRNAVDFENLNPIEKENQLEDWKTEVSYAVPEIATDNIASTLTEAIGGGEKVASLISGVVSSLLGGAKSGIEKIKEKANDYQNNKKVETPEPQSQPAPSQPTAPTKSTEISVGDKVKADSSAPIYGTDTAKNGSNQYFKNDPRYKVLDIKNGRAKVGTLSGGLDGSQFSGWIDLSKLKKYAAGGLATSTGPAWLDGTPSKPEYVLNAAQTKAFLKLADYTEGFIKAVNNKQTTENNSSVNYYINVNVEQMSSDYDVDSAINRLKSEITSSSDYRNVRSIKLTR